MLKAYTYSKLSNKDIEGLIQRNTDSGDEIRRIAEDIIEKVRVDGDKALKAFALQFDNISLDQLVVERAEIENLAKSISEEQKKALQLAYDNIYKFHIAQLQKEDKIQTMEGVTCWRESRPIERVGLYIPGGTAVLPSTFLMLGIPARIAGCKQIVVCSPPRTDKQGQINGAIAFCAKLLNIEKIFLTGGAQAIAAMAYGTQSIPKVDKIFGPGNQYVTMAKTIVQSTTQTAIDMPAGPSEVLVIADDSANPVFVAADLLAQAEHGIDSQAVLVSTSPEILTRTIEELNRQLPVLPRAEIAGKAIQNSYAVVVKDLKEAMEFSNLYAPEHLILAADRCEEIIDQISNAGSVFVGHLTPESVGDYASGTNHTLPTSSYARSYSGVSVDSFVKKITFQHITEKGIKNIGPAVEILAGMEGLEAHRNAVTVRLEQGIKNKE
jgi:histidinol dehydrogenase